MKAACVGDIEVERSGFLLLLCSLLEISLCMKWVVTGRAEPFPPQKHLGHLEAHTDPSFFFVIEWPPGIGTGLTPLGAHWSTGTSFLCIAFLGAGCI